MKKSYFSPKFDSIKIELETMICVSAETPIDDIIEYDDDGDDV